MDELCVLNIIDGMAPRLGGEFFHKNISLSARTPADKLIWHFCERRKFSMSA